MTGYYTLRGEKAFQGSDIGPYFLKISTPADQPQVIDTVWSVHAATLQQHRNLTSDWAGATIPTAWTLVERLDPYALDEGL